MGGRERPGVLPPLAAPEARSGVAVALVLADEADHDPTRLLVPGEADADAVRALAPGVAAPDVLEHVEPAALVAGLVPGADADQWDEIERYFALKKGSSTIEVIDSVINLSDTVTFYHPVGDPTPAWRYVVDQIKVMNVVYNVRLIFEDPEWAGAVLIPSGQSTTNPRAKTPSMAKAEIARMLDSLEEIAIISDAAFAKSTIVADISPTNPKRLDISFTYKISGNTNQISIDAKWGFYFGGSQQAAA